MKIMPFCHVEVGGKDIRIQSEYRLPVNLPQPYGELLWCRSLIPSASAYWKCPLALKTAEIRLACCTISASGELVVCRVECETIKLKFYRSSFPRSILVASSGGCHEDATRKMVTWNLSLTQLTRNAWQSLAYSPLGAVVSPPSEYL